MTLRLNASRVASALGALQWVLTVCTGLVFVQTFFFRPQITLPSFAEGSMETAEPAPAKEEPTLDALAGIWSRSLRQTLIEPKPIEPPARKAPPPPAPVALPKLAATFVENGRAWALLVDDKGTARVRTTSDKIGDFVIAAITPGVATLTRDDKTYEVRTPARESKGVRQSRRGS